MLTSRAATRIAFGVIIAFVTAQMSWWLFFQQRYVSEVSTDTVESLEREAESLNQLLALGAVEQVDVLLSERPHLRLANDGLSVELAAESLGEFLHQQRRVVRMLAFEGPFFVLVVMTGLFIIGRSLRLERELKRHQRNFLDAIGHEYKTPISTLRLLIETLQLRTLAPAKLQEYLQSMRLEVDRLERTGQQVLATARLEAGAPPERREPHDLTELVRHVIARSRPALEANGARLDLTTSDGPLPVRAVLDDVSILVENLLDNALKYTPAAEKSVTVQLERQGNWALLSVEDRGPGIPDRERALVFERFYRVGNELTRTATGLGLGLYLVRRAAEGLGGHVEIDNAEQGGARVTIRLPLEPTVTVGAPAAELRGVG